MSKELPLYGFGGGGGGSSSYLYNLGKQKYAWGIDAWFFGSPDSYAQDYPIPTLNDDGSISLILSNVKGSTTKQVSGVYHLLKDFDLTNVNQLVFEGFGKRTDKMTTTAGRSSVYIAVVPRTASYWGSDAVAKTSFSCTTTETEYTKTLDVSGITGSYDVVIGMLTTYIAEVCVTMKTLKAVR